MNWGKIRQVIRREYVESVRKKSFLFGLLATPVMMLGLIALPLFTGDFLSERVFVVGVLDDAGEYGERLRAGGDEELRFVVYPPPDVPAAPFLDALVISGELGAWIRVRDDFAATGVVEYHAETVTNLIALRGLELHLERLLAREKASRFGVAEADVDALLAGVDLETYRIGDGGREASFDQVYFHAVALVMIMFFALIPTGQILMRSVIEEKSSRVIEVLLSSVTAKELMVGKIIGLGAVGLTLIGTWTAIGALIASRLGSGFPIGGGDLGVFVLYFLPGYFFYALPPGARRPAVHDADLAHAHSSRDARLRHRAEPGSLPRSSRVVRPVLRTEPHDVPVHHQGAASLGDGRHLGRAAREHGSDVLGVVADLPDRNPDDRQAPHHPRSRPLGPGPMKLLREKRLQAPEIKPVGWAGDALFLGELKGRVVLLDFFSFGDPAGVQALGRIRRLGDHYRDVGFTVIGVHVPAYEFERPLEPARQEIWRLGIPYPVALDHGFEVYRAYDNRDLPARWLVDGDGFVRFWHHGAEGLVELEKAVRVLVREAKPDRSLPPLLEPDGEVATPGALRWSPTAEIRFGTHGVGFGPPDDKDASEGATREFESMPELRAEGAAYLEGRWTLGADRVRSDSEGALAVVFEGSRVVALVSPEGQELTPDGEAPRFGVSLDGDPLPEAIAGADVEIEDGESFVTIERGRLYELISGAGFGIHNLDLRVSGPGVAFHLLSFGTTEVPEET